MTSSPTRRPHKPNYLIVGLSGVTNGGKTTLARRLAAHYPRAVETLLLDDYFITDTSRLEPVPELNHWNFEELNSLDVEAFMRDVNKVIQRFSSNPHCSARDQILIVDGFLLFNIPSLLPLIHLRYDFTLPYAVAKQRRAQRVYNPPDVDGYFDAIAWPAYLKHAEEVEALKKKEKIVTLDGTQEGDVIFERVVADIEQALSDS